MLFASGQSFYGRAVEAKREVCAPEGSVWGTLPWSSNDREGGIWVTADGQPVKDEKETKTQRSPTKSPASLSAAQSPGGQDSSDAGTSSDESDCEIELPSGDMVGDEVISGVLGESGELQAAMDKVEILNHKLTVKNQLSKCAWSYLFFIF